jgi:3-hydroxy-9,10-secoandrosta-1,3,5(10)-triene-9,17-dione monooxygenase
MQANLLSFLSSELRDRCDDIALEARSRAQEAESLRRVPSLTIDAIRSSGLNRILRPSAWGGLGLSWPEYFDASVRIARGCGSTGWCFAFLNLHDWMVSRLPQQAQSEVWSNSAASGVATALAPMGILDNSTDVPTVGGEWNWASGIDHCDWILIGAIAPEMRNEVVVCLVPRADFTIVDNWHVSGMRATGSKGVKITAGSLPKHRIIKLSDLRDGTGAANDGPDQVGLAMVGASAFAATAIGIAEGVLADWTRLTRAKQAALSVERLARASQVHVRTAESALELETARYFARCNLDLLSRGGPYGISERVRSRAAWDYSVMLCVRAVDRIFHTAGASVMYDDNPIQRGWRDVHALSNHFGLRFEASGDNLGRELFALPRNPYDHFY